MRHAAAVVPVRAVVKEEHLFERDARLPLQRWKVLPPLGARIDLPVINEIGHCLAPLRGDGKILETGGGVRRLRG